MSQRIVVDCDVHGARDEAAPGIAYDLVVRRQGDAFMFLTIDLCEVCAKPLGDLFAELADFGRTFDDGAAAQLRTATASARARKRIPQAVEPGAPTGEFICPTCGNESGNIGALRTHVRNNHDTTLDELRGDPLPFACPDCDRAFARPQGLGAHRARAHGYRTGADEVRADG